MPPPEPPPAPAPPDDAGSVYRRARGRLTALLAERPLADWERPVAACPGWSVHGTVAHLVGTVEDALAGRLSGPPPEEMTAEQVVRHAATPGPELLARWTELAPPFEEVVGAGEIWPAAFDVTSHEHDVRTALGVPGDRDDPFLVDAAARLVGGMRGPWVLEVELAEGPVVRSQGDGPVRRLRTTAFEVVRLRLGRRSPDQVRSLGWAGDAPEDLGPLFVFGPRPDALVE